MTERLFVDMQTVLAWWGRHDSRVQTQLLASVDLTVAADDPTQIVAITRAYFRHGHPCRLREVTA